MIDKKYKYIDIDHNVRDKKHMLMSVVTFIKNRYLYRKSADVLIVKTFFFAFNVILTKLA